MTLPLTEGIWRGVLDISNDTQKEEVPFNFEVKADHKIVILNGEERIKVADVNFDSNQIQIKMPVFGSDFTLSSTDSTLNGYWNNYNKDNYQLPFNAQINRPTRFDITSKPDFLLPQRWKVTFSPETKQAYPAVGLFETNKEGIATGTFLTETGDYRFLEGSFDGQLLQLSCFDGSHVFLFKAALDSAGHLNGRFWSGKHWNEPWIAVPDTNFQLRAMDELTYLKEGYDNIEFRFPDKDSIMIAQDDARFKQKATIVQITGSWCPNCMDETNFLVDIYQKYHPEGLEIVAVDYEIKDDFEVFRQSQKRLQEQLGVQYPILYGGQAKKSAASLTWPMLNEISSYPTTIFIDKKGAVRAIHTGFSGPGTGEIYEQYKQNTVALIERLISE